MKLHREAHDLGYVKYHLRLFGYGVRLHIWQPGTGTDSHPHDHGWSFVSVPLWGSFVDIRWELTGQPGACQRHLWTRANRAGDQLLPTAARDQLAQVGGWVRRPLRPYRCRVGEIHSYRPNGRGVQVSLVLVGRVRSTVTTVWVTTSGRSSDDG